MKKGAAIFSILMGLAMFGTWSFLFLFAGFPQARTQPLETGYLLTAESLTAAALVAAGYGVLSHRNWAMPLILVALGELIYCAIRFAGELGQGGSLGRLSAWSGLQMICGGLASH
jgi:hypothetical protein